MGTKYHINNKGHKVICKATKRPCKYASSQVSPAQMQQPMMTDEQLVLQYCSGKGYATNGLTAVEALKGQLKAENGGKDHPRVDIAQYVYLATISFANLRIPASQHWERIQPAALTPPSKGEKPIAGVVLENPDGTYTLVDGYHRTKGLKTEGQATQADYFVLG